MPIDPTSPAPVQLDERERATVLCALRAYQLPLTIGRRYSQDLMAIATHGGRVIPLDAEEIDRLIERLNQG